MACIPKERWLKVMLDEFVVTYAHYACVADCADAMADTWEDTAGCKYTSDFPIRYDRTEYPACMHAVSAICLWATVRVCNMVSVMYFEP